MGTKVQMGGGKCGYQIDSKVLKGKGKCSEMGTKVQKDGKCGNQMGTKVLKRRGKWGGNWDKGIEGWRKKW